MPTWLGTRMQRLRALLIIALGILVWMVLRHGGPALVPFLIGGVLAYIMIPAVDFLHSHAPRALRGKRVTRTLAIILVYILFFGLLGGLLSYFIPELIAQMQQLIRTIPELYRPLDSRLATDLEALLERIPEGIRSSVEEGFQTAIRAIGDTLQRGLQRTVQTVWQTVTFVIGMAIVPIWVFLLAQGRRCLSTGLLPLGAGRSAGRCPQYYGDHR
jgi:predicted PurR-regulated permease PerM